MDGTGDRSDSDTHHSKGEQLKPEVSSITEDTIKKVNERLDLYEASLYEKDKEIASLKDKLEQQEQKQQQQNEQQRQLEDEMVSLKQTQEEYKQRQQNLEDDVTCWKEKNGILEQEIKQQKSRIDELNMKIETWQSAMTGKGVCVNTQPSNDNSSKNKKAVAKVVPVQHHRGKPGGVIVSEDFHKVVFKSFSTVSAPTAAVPRGARVWYEVYIRPDFDCSQQIGWSTADLPTSDEDFYFGVGDEKDSYGFDPHIGKKYHGGATEWGETLTKRGGYVGVGLDTVTGEILFSLNGDWTRPMGVAFTGVDADTQLFPAVSGQYCTMEINFGHRNFKYGPPSSNFEKLVDTLS